MKGTRTVQNAGLRAVSFTLLALFMLLSVAPVIRAQSTIGQLYQGQFDEIGWDEASFEHVWLTQLAIGLHTQCRDEALNGPLGAEQAAAVVKIGFENPALTARLIGMSAITPAHPIAVATKAWLSSRGGFENCADPKLRRLFVNITEYITSWRMERRQERQRIASEKASQFRGYQEYTWEHSPRIHNFEDVFRVFLDSLRAFPYKSAYIPIQLIIDPQGDPFDVGIKEIPGITDIPSEKEIGLAAKILEMMLFSPANDYASTKPGWTQLYFSWDHVGAMQGLPRGKIREWRGKWTSNLGYLSTRIAHRSITAEGEILICGWDYEYGAGNRGPDYSDHEGNSWWNEKCRYYHAPEAAPDEDLPVKP